MNGTDVRRGFVLWRPRRGCAIAILTVLCVAALLGIDRARPRPVVTFSAAGGFSLAGEYKSDWVRDVPGRRWASWSGSDANTGKLSSAPFQAPYALVMALDGYPSRDVERVELERADTGERVRVDVPDSGEKWMYHFVSVPAPLRGRMVRLVLTDAGKGRGDWVGIGGVRAAYVDEIVFARPILSGWAYLGLLYAALIAAAVTRTLRASPRPARLRAPVYLLSCAVAVVVAYMIGWTNDDLSGWFAAWGRNALTYGPTGAYTHWWATDNPPVNPSLMVIPAMLEGLLRTSDAHLVPFSFRLIPLASLFVLPLLVRAAVVAAGVAVSARTFAAIVLCTVLNPAFFYDSAVWGQSDVFVSVLMLVALIAFMSGQAFFGTLVYAGSILTKPQPILALPVFAVLALRSRRPLHVVGAIVLALVLVLPITYAHGGVIAGYQWLWELYVKASGEYAWGSVGAGTLPALLTGDGLNPDTVAGPFGLTIGRFANLCAALAAAGVLAAALAERNRLTGKLAIWYVATSCMVIYWFAPHMHERYIGYAAVFAVAFAFTVRTRTAMTAAVALCAAMFVQMISSWPLDLGWGADIATTLTRLTPHHTYYVLYVALNAIGLGSLVASRFRRPRRLLLSSAAG